MKSNPHLRPSRQLEEPHSRQLLLNEYCNSDTQSKHSLSLSLSLSSCVTQRKTSSFFLSHSPHSSYSSQKRNLNLLNQCSGSQTRIRKLPLIVPWYLNFHFMYYKISSLLCTHNKYGNFQTLHCIMENINLYYLLKFIN